MRKITQILSVLILILPLNCNSQIELHFNSTKSIKTESNKDINMSVTKFTDTKIVIKKDSIFFFVVKRKSMSLKIKSSYKKSGNRYIIYEVENKGKATIIYDRDLETIKVIEKYNGRTILFFNQFL